MKLLLFILGITLITASPTLRGLLNLNLGESGENTEGIFVVFEGHEDVNALSDNFSFNWNFDNNGESGESSLEQALEEENIIISEEEILPDLLTQVRNDPATNDILDFGVSTVIASGIEKGKIPNITFTVTSISALATTTSNQGDLYDFSLEANGQNGNSSSVIDMNFTVYYDFASQRRILSAYSFVITTTTVTVTPSQPSGPQNGYVQISDADIETNAEVQEVLEYGIEQIYTIGTQAGNIPAFGSFKANIVSVWKQVTNTGANYLCEVVLDNKNNVTVNANFTVAYVANTQQSTLTSYKYTVSNIIVTPPSNNTNTTTPSQPTNTTNSTTPVGNNNSTNTTTNATIDGFTALSADEIQSAPVQAALGYGVNQILENGYAKGKIPVSQYNVGNVSSVLEKTVGKRTTYRFAAVISGANKANISATFDVFLQNSNFSMGGWTYNITTIRNATNPTNSTNTTTPTQPTNTTNSTTPTGPTNTTTNSTTPTGPTNTTTPTQPANNTNTTTPVGNNSTNTTTPGGFTALSVAEIQSAPVQAVLAYGTNQLIQSGNAKGKIPVSVYNITKINSVLMMTQAKSTLYESDVILQDANNVTIAAVFNVSVNAATQGLFVNGWSYTVTNLKPQNNTNTNTTTNTTNSTTPTGPANTTTPTQPTNTTNSTTPTGPTNTTTNSTTPTGPSNTTTPTQPANTTNTTTPVGNNNSTNTTTNATTGGFTALSAAQIQSAQVQAVLAYGTNQLIQSGNAKGKIPVSVYNITKVNSVLMMAQAKSTLYESDVVLQDANNVTIAAVFNVTVNAATQGLFVNGWSYTVTNLKPQNNTNTTATTASTTTNTTSVNTNNSTNTNTNTTSIPNTISTANTTDSTSNTTSANNATPAVPITNNSTNTTGTTSN